jgi:Domain of Unknown Function (DUF1206)
LSAIGGRRDGGGRDSSPGERLIAAGRAVVYTTLCASTIILLAGAGGENSGNRGRAWTARLMRAPFGRALIFTVGLVIIVVGAAMAWRGVLRQFDVDLPSCRRLPRIVAILGTIGTIARGVVIGLIGLFLLEAAVTYDANKARGLDATLKSLARQPHGSVLLSLVAAGFISFGVSSILAALYARLSTE